MHTQPGIADKFIADLKACVREIMKDPGQPVEGKMAIYGMAQSIPDRSVVGDVTRAFLNSMYYTPAKNWVVFRWKVHEHLLFIRRIRLKLCV